MKTRKFIALATALTICMAALPSVNAVTINTELEPIIFGDANNDKSVNGSDVLRVITHFLDDAEYLSEENADVNRSGKIELTDLATIKQYSVGDTVTMGGRSFDSTFRSENNQLVPHQQSLVIPIENFDDLAPYEENVFLSTCYKDSCERLEELGLAEHVDFIDNYSKDGNALATKTYFLFSVLRKTDDITIWASKEGFDLQTKSGESDCVIITPIFDYTISMTGETFGYPAAKGQLRFTKDLNTPITNIGYIVDVTGTEPTTTDYTGTMPVTLKPVIYLYPEKETDVHVELDYEGTLTFTYPEYPENGWDVTAQPDGTLTDKDGYEYSYLFWDGYDEIKWNMSEGFVVKGEDTVSFLREKLSYMGLTPREYNEFIVFWLPRMQNNKYNLITFQQDMYTDAAELDITPQPDSMQRVFMAYQALDEYVDVPEQELPTFEREGFTVVEWGGTEVK